MIGQRAPDDRPFHPGAQGEEASALRRRLRLEGRALARSLMETREMRDNFREWRTRWGGALMVVCCACLSLFYFGFGRPVYAHSPLFFPFPSLPHNRDQGAAGPRRRRWTTRTPCLPPPSPSHPWATAATRSRRREGKWRNKEGEGPRYVTFTRATHDWGSVQRYMVDSTMHIHREWEPLASSSASTP